MIGSSGCPSVVPVPDTRSLQLLLLIIPGLLLTTWHLLVFKFRWINNQETLDQLIPKVEGMPTFSTAAWWTCQKLSNISSQLVWTICHFHYNFLGSFTETMPKKFWILLNCILFHVILLLIATHICKQKRSQETINMIQHIFDFHIQLKLRRNVFILYDIDSKCSMLAWEKLMLIMVMILTIFFEK